MNARPPQQPRQDMNQQTMMAQGRQNIPQQTMAAQGRSNIPQQTMQAPGRANIPQQTMAAQGRANIPQQTMSGMQGGGFMGGQAQKRGGGVLQLPGSRPTNPDRAPQQTLNLGNAQYMMGGSTNSRPDPKQPGQMQWNPAASSPVNDFLEKWRGTEASNYGKYASDDVRDQASGYMQNYAVPLINAMQADRTQGFNEASWMQNFGEQQYLNRHQTQMDMFGNAREDRALDYGILSGNRDFDEGKRQFDVNTIHNKYNLDTERLDVNNQFTLGNQRNANELELGRGALFNDSNRINNEYLIGVEQNRIDDMYKRGELSNQQYANETNRLAQSSQDQQWRQQLGFSREELAMNAQLERENMKNQLTQSRYGAFGRSQAPSQNLWARSWA